MGAQGNQREGRRGEKTKEEVKEMRNRMMAEKQREVGGRREDNTPCGFRLVYLACRLLGFVSG